MRNGSAVLIIAALLALALAPSGAQATNGRCPDVTMFPHLKHTSPLKARIVVSNTSCAKARTVFRHWLAANRAEKKTRTSRRLDGYTCRFSGTQRYQVRCATGSHVVRASWGVRK